MCVGLIPDRAHTGGCSFLFLHHHLERTRKPLFSYGHLSVFWLLGDYNYELVGDWLILEWLPTQGGEFQIQGCPPPSLFPFPKLMWPFCSFWYPHLHPPHPPETPLMWKACLDSVSRGDWWERRLFKNFQRVLHVPSSLSYLLYL